MRVCGKACMRRGGWGPVAESPNSAWRPTCSRDADASTLAPMASTYRWGTGGKRRGGQCSPFLYQAAGLSTASAGCCPSSSDLRDAGDELPGWLAVLHPTHLLDQAEVRAVRGALEGHVLEQVRDACASPRGQSSSSRRCRVRQAVVRGAGSPLPHARQRPHQDHAGRRRSCPGIARTRVEGRLVHAAGIDVDAQADRGALCVRVCAQLSVRQR